MNFEEMASRYDTPLYLYDFGYMRERFNELKEAFSGRKSLICYAIKSNSNLSVIEHFKDM
jgi:diaminopimelate decarboxylase